MINHHAIAYAIKQAMHNNDFQARLQDASGGGPFDGGCLICAKALILAAGTGALVRLASDDNAAEHFGAEIDGIVYDFDGPALSSGHWLQRFSTKESFNRLLRFEPGYAQNDDLPIPEDPATEKALADLLSSFGVSPSRRARNRPGFG